MKLFKSVLVEAYLCLLIFVLPSHNVSKKKMPDIAGIQNFSSVWCSSGLGNSKMCTFTNICYNYHTSFIFILTEHSILSGLSSKDDLKNIYATSVLGHSALPLKITIIFNKKLPVDQWYIEPTFLLHRFKPDNFMHVIHDDLLPLYTTYTDLCLGDATQCAVHFNLIFSDHNIEGPFIKWYRAFSKTRPLQLSRLNSSYTVCFSELQVGLSVDSIFYQYGFTKPKGGSNVSSRVGNLINNFRLFMLQHFNITSRTVSKPQLVFISRQLNRKILNENFVETVIQTTYKREFNTSLKIFKTDFTIHSVEDILYVVSESKYFLGMHGAGMFMGIFLPQNAIILELFPFGINETNISPLYSMSQISGIQFKYFSWKNRNALNSFPHPEYPPSFGGLSNLPELDQINILNATASTPSYECCDDTLFLFRMYQDTLVDDSILEQMKLMFTYKSEINSKILLRDIFLKDWFYPSFVQNISCLQNISGLFLSWLPPLNVDTSTNVLYRIHIETVNRSISLLTNRTMFEYMFSVGSSIKFWIMCLINGTEGLDSYITC